MAEKRSTYHHGDLRAALIQAADAIIAEGGLEAFSLRAAAQRAGVSPGAPAHHFGGARGLLTEVALLAHERLGRSMARIAESGDIAADIRAMCLAYVAFALDHPGHFRLMIRNDLVNRSDLRSRFIGVDPIKRLGRAIAAYHGNPDVDLSRFEDAADMFWALSAVHGLASLVLEEKSAAFFQNATAREFVNEELPRMLERMYPTKK